MSTTYTIVVHTPIGTQLAEVSRFNRLEYVLTENAVGAVSLTMAEPIPYNWYQRDTIIEIWRSVDGRAPHLEGETVWFVRRPEDVLAESGAETHTLTAYDAKDLLRRRIVAYRATTSQSQKTAPYDNMIKAIVRDNLSSSATDPLRDLGLWFSVAPDLSLTTSFTKGFSFRNVLMVLQEIAEACAGAGTYLSFDIVKTSVAPILSLEFRTYVGQRGVDHRYPTSGSPVLVSPEIGNIATAHIVDDSTQEVNVAYGGGAGQELARSLRLAVDQRAYASPWNRIEVFMDWANATDAEIDASLLALIRNGVPRRTFTGTLTDTTGVRYGVHYGWGDIVTAQYRGQVFNCRVNPVQVVIDDLGEHINTVLTADTLLT